MGIGGYIYWFRCAACLNVYQIWCLSSGSGGMGGSCPKCGCGNVQKIAEEKVE